MDIFENCQKINSYIRNKEELNARNELIKLLDHHSKNSIPYSPLVNHLIRETGLYPYIKSETAIWQDQYIFDIFKVDIGRSEMTLHREQSALLNGLIDGEDIAVSAPTSFGKSFVIDAFITIKKPNNVVIIVPTIALMDETRRRLYKKFSDEYKIITNTGIELGKKNILIFPQERALKYASQLETIDLLVIDEFYKASSTFDKERSATLIRAIMNLSKIAQQRYYLAPNISTIEKNTFTKDMNFQKLDFNTVYLEKNDVYKKIGDDKEKKSDFIVNFLNSNQNSKTLMYAGTYKEIEKLCDIIQKNIQDDDHPKPLLKNFKDWLSTNYDPSWSLTKLVLKRTGIHNGQLHRSLSQLQIKLFDEEEGLDNLISTSSIIEGVNTAAENVIIWRNLNGPKKLNDFSYKNIIGRGGRMFKHFIGKIYTLEPPPKSEETQLELPFPDELLGEIDEAEYDTFLTSSQSDKAKEERKKIEDLIGRKQYKELLDSKVLQSNPNTRYNIISSMRKERNNWNGLGFLNSDDTNEWDRFLYKFLEFKPSEWGIEYGKFVSFVKKLSKNWTKSIPELLNELKEDDISIGNFFKLERYTAFNLGAIVNDVNEIQKRMIPEQNVDLSPFLFKVSHVFLPSAVYQLEEYGLPRMLSRKIHQSGLIDLENTDLTIDSVIKQFEEIGLDQILKQIAWSDFEEYILKYFYSGISLEPT